MAKRGIPIRGSSAALGGLSTQAIRGTQEPNVSGVASRPGQTVVGAPATTGLQSPGVVAQTTSNRGTVAITQSGRGVANIASLRSTDGAIAAVRPLVTVRPAVVVRPVTSARLTVPLSNTLAKVIPNFTLKLPLLRPKTIQSFPEDTLNVSETRFVNNKFVPVEENGISVFRPEIISIMDFHPIWKGFRPYKLRRSINGLSPAGKLIDIQYNALWMRRDTIVNVLDGIQSRRAENTRQIFTRLRNDFQAQIDRTRRTVNQYATFIKKVELAKDSLDIRKINRASYTSGFLPLPEFFSSRMQLGPDEFETYSDTKILMQLLADFKAICEGYSYNLLDLVDRDRVDDRSPVTIDRTYTQQDGFTFSVEQLRSRTAPINATNRDYFNRFLNSLPPNPDDRVKLLLTVLSKELRVSKGLGDRNNQTTLQNVFNAGSFGSPFDNIIGVVGSTIFDQPLGPQSLASTLIRRIDRNSFVLPFERKYVDSDETKQTYVPGSAYFIDTVFELDGKRFNTRPFSDYANEFTAKFIFGKYLIERLFELTGKETPLAPRRMIDAVLASYRRSISGTATVTGLNKDQAIVMAIFSLANEDNRLKSLLFQFLLMVGLAQNTVANKKPVFTNLANEFKTIRAFPDVMVTKLTNPNILLGLNVLRPYLQRLATDIENRIFALTTVIPRINLGIAFTTRPDYNRFQINNTPSTIVTSPFDRLTVQPIVAGQTTVNVLRGNIINVLMSAVEPRTSATPNLLKEFIDLSNAFTQAATVNGESVYLLDDNSGRSRYNFVSTSTQLLVIFEILASLASKYNFSKFGKSQTPFNTFIKVDANYNDFIKDTIDDIIGVPTNSVTLLTPLSTNLRDAFRPTRAYRPSTTFQVATSPLQRLRQTATTTIARSYNSSFNTSRTARAGGALSTTRNTLNVSQGTLGGRQLSETNLIQNNLGSPFLSPKVISQLGITRFNLLKLSTQPNKLKNSLISIRNKIKDESQIQQNILDILSVIERRVRTGNQDFQNGFSQAALDTFLQENTIQDLEIIRTPAQVRLAKFLVEDMSARRVSAVTERLASDGSDQVGTFFTGEEHGVDTATNNLVDEETVQPATRETMYSMLSEPLYLRPNLADIRTKIISVGIPGGFSKQLSDRVQQSAINENTFRDKQFDVVAINVYKRDARFDDIVFKPQTFLFDLSLFPDSDFSYLQPRENETFSRILQRARVRDLEQFSGFYSGAPTFRTIENIVNDDKYNFIPSAQKTELIRNHIQSSILQTYIRLLTGLRIEESTFTVRSVNRGSNFNQEFQNLVLKYLKEDLRKTIPNKPIMDILEDPNVDDESKDILRLFTFGGVIFEPTTFRNKVVTPKLFDRVFHIAFNTEQFEIDLELTNETQAGKNAMSQNFVQERLIVNGGRTYLRTKERNELAFEDYFVSITNNI